MNTELENYWNRIIKSDEEALEKLYKATFSLLVNYSRTITFDYHMAEEAVQDVFIKIWQNRSTLFIHDSIRAYLFRSVHNHSLNLLRRQKTLRQSVNQLASENLWSFITEHYELNEGVIENMFVEDTRSLVKEVLESLPEQCRKVFSMSRFDGLTNEEIAIQLKITQNTVKTHIYKALLKISDALKKK